MTHSIDIVTPDLCDAHPEVAVLDPMFANFGGLEAFYGPIRTIKCFEDNSMVKQAVAEPGSLCTAACAMWRYSPLCPLVFRR